MIEIYNLEDKTIIKNDKNILISLDINNNEVKIGDYLIDSPGEYEKSGFLLEVMEINNKLIYNFVIEGKKILILFYDDIELTENVLSFFGDIDILIIIGTKNSVKIFENIETRIVIPIGEGKDVFLNTLGQKKEEVNNFKLRSELGIDNTEFVNLV